MLDFILTLSPAYVGNVLMSLTVPAIALAFWVKDKIQYRMTWKRWN